MKEKDKKAAKALRQIINGNHPAASRISIAYTGRKPGSEARAEVERFSKRLHLRAEQRRGAIC